MNKRINQKYIIKRKEINFHGYNIQLQKKRIKNINLMIRTDGSINLSVPFQLKEQELHEFLESKKDWIRKNKSKFKQVEPKAYITGETVDYLGMEYILNIQETDFKQKIEIDGKNLNVFVFKRNNKKEYLENFINDWYKSNLIFIVTDLTEIWANKLNVKVNEIKIRKLKRTWGSCNINKKLITYSVELAKKDRKLIEYVVVHELSHLIYDNHGKEFKQLLDKLIPDWRNRKRELNNMKECMG